MSSHAESAPSSAPFRQTAPGLGNQYDDDRVLRGYLRRLFGEDLSSFEPALREMGELAGGELFALQQEDRESEPRLVQWDAWGSRVDQIEVTEVWKRVERIAAEHGVVASAYDPELGELARVHQFALAYLYTPASDTFACPLAMTDGAATTLLSSGQRDVIERAVPHLTSRDPEQFWTSGQWMTESIGGSDVSRTETIAKQDEDGTWRLWGRKWFTSAAASQMALTLARPVGNPEGSRGLALFYVEVRNEEGQLDRIQVNRLKDKLGTKKLPTAELTLDGTPAILVGESKNGVRNITPMLNITRTWNAITAVTSMRRAIALAKDYATKRTAFGAKLIDKPLHLSTLADMQAEFEAGFHLAFAAVELVGKVQAKTATEDELRMLRLITPLAKLTTGKQVVALCSEALECFGGAGYVEDTGLPALLRDAQVLPIWEGTTNVLSLDSLRAIASGGALEALLVEMQRCVSLVKDSSLSLAASQALEAAMTAATFMKSNAMTDAELVEANARGVALTLGRALALAKLCAHAEWSLANGDEAPRAAAIRFARLGISRLRVSDIDEARRLLR